MKENKKGILCCGMRDFFANFIKLRRFDDISTQLSQIIKEHAETRYNITLEDVNFNQMLTIASARGKRDLKKKKDCLSYYKQRGASLKDIIGSI